MTLFFNNNLNHIESEKYIYVFCISKGALFRIIFLLYGIIIVSGDSVKPLTLKTLSKFVADDILKFIYLFILFYLFFFHQRKEDFMRIVYSADDSHVMSSYFL